MSVTILYFVKWSGLYKKTIWTSCESKLVNTHIYGNTHACEHSSMHMHMNTHTHSYDKHKPLKDLFHKICYATRVSKVNHKFLKSEHTHVTCDWFV